VTTHGHVAGSQRRTIENLREANAGLVKQLAEQQVEWRVDIERHMALHLRVEAVLALHHETEIGEGYSWQTTKVCAECDSEWPCPTRRALEGEP